MPSVFSHAIAAVAIGGVAVGGRSRAIDLDLRVCKAARRQDDVERARLGLAAGGAGLPGRPGAVAAPFRAGCRNARGSLVIGAREEMPRNTPSWSTRIRPTSAPGPTQSERTPIGAPTAPTRRRWPTP